MAASLKDICEANEVGLHIFVRMVDAVADPGLRSEVNDAVELVLFEAGANLGIVRKVCPYEGVGYIAVIGRLFQDPQARFLQRRVVIGIDCIEANHIVAALQ